MTTKMNVISAVFIGILAAILFGRFLGLGGFYNINLETAKYILIATFIPAAGITYFLYWRAIKREKETKCI